MSIANKDLEVATKGLVCALCGADHSELVKLLAEREKTWTPTSEWLVDREALLLELAEQRRQGKTEGEYWGYLQHRLAIVEGELQRRRELMRYGGPSIPNRSPLSKDVLQEIKCRVRLDEVMERYVEVYGTRYPLRYRCPAHGDGFDRDPSGVIYGDGHYWCFGCNGGGDVFTALQSFGGMSFKEAVEALAREAGIDLAHSRPSPLRQALRQAQGEALRSESPQSGQGTARRLKGAVL